MQGYRYYNIRREVLEERDYNQILSHIVSITENRDIEILEISLVKTIFEVIPCTCVSMIKSGTDNPDLKSAMCYDSSGYHSSFSGHIANLEVLGTGIQMAYRTGKIRVMEDEGCFYIICPIVVLKKNIGFIAVKTSSFREHEPQILDSLIRIYQNYVSVLVDNQRDTLTGLLNRKTFDDRIMKLVELKKKEINHAEQNNDRRKHLAGRFWLGIFDIDYFKKINDTFGHVFGDEILILMSRLIQSLFRNDDLVFRYGGEEFITVARAENPDDVYALFERFRKKVESYNFPQVGRVTVSIGIVEITGYDIPTSFVGCADRALHYAKEHGRNMTCMYSDLVKQGLIPSGISEGRIIFFDD